jgi:hypothetical protein
MVRRWIHETETNEGLQFLVMTKLGSEVGGEIEEFKG